MIPAQFQLCILWTNEHYKWGVSPSAGDHMAPITACVKSGEEHLTKSRECTQPHHRYPGYTHTPSVNYKLMAQHQTIASSNTGSSSPQCLKRLERNACQHISTLPQRCQTHDRPTCMQKVQAVIKSFHPGTTGVALMAVLMSCSQLIRSDPV